MGLEYPIQILRKELYIIDKALLDTKKWHEYTDSYKRQEAKKNEIIKSIEILNNEQINKPS